MIIKTLIILLLFSCRKYISIAVSSKSLFHLDWEYFQSCDFLMFAEENNELMESFFDLNQNYQPKTIFSFALLESNKNLLNHIGFNIPTKEVCSAVFVFDPSLKDLLNVVWNFRSWRKDSYFFIVKSDSETTDKNINNYFKVTRKMDSNIAYLLVNARNYESKIFIPSPYDKTLVEVFNDDKNQFSWKTVWKNNPSKMIPDYSNIPQQAVILPYSSPYIQELEYCTSMYDISRTFRGCSKDIISANIIYTHHNLTKIYTPGNKAIEKEVSGYLRINVVPLAGYQIPNKYILHRSYSAHCNNRALVGVT